MKIRISQLPQTITSYQKCIIPPELLPHFKKFESYISLGLRRSNSTTTTNNNTSKLLLRVCKSSVGIGVTPGIIDLQADLRVQLLTSSDGESDEMALRCLLAASVSTGRTFHKHLCTLSEDLQILEIGSIKQITVTLIVPDDFRSNPIASRSSLRDKIKLLFQTHDLHVMKQTLVDFRTDPLAALCPSFVFVEDCKSNGEIGHITSKTEIIISNIRPISYYKVIEQTQVVHGLEKVTDILSLITAKPVSSANLLISGPSGCGKQLAVRETVKKLRANLVIHQQLLVERSWTELFSSALNDGTTVILIPKIESIHKQSKLVNHVCSLIDSVSQNTVVVATTNRPYLIPNKLRRRFVNEVHIAPPTEIQRLKILEAITENIKLTTDLASIAKRTPGYVRQDLVKLIHLALLKAYEEDGELADIHVKYALSRILPTVLQGALGVGIHQQNASLDQIAGLKDAKLDLIKAIVWPIKFPQAFTRMNIRPSKGILLHSPPGCAKTTLIRAISASNEINFLSVSAAELFSSAVGDSEKIIADLFHRARIAAPSILFIDELEAIVGSRQISKKSSNENILSMLLTEMDGVADHSQTSVLVVAATNRLDLIDSALIRPGRFDKLIHVPPLDESGRLDLLNICGKTIPFDNRIQMDEIARDTKFYSGADLVNLCREAALFALTEDMETLTVSAAHLAKAMTLLGPSLCSTDSVTLHSFQ